MIDRIGRWWKSSKNYNIVFVAIFRALVRPRIYTNYIVMLIWTTEWCILFNQNPRWNHQGRIPESEGRKYLHGWFLGVFWLNRIPNKSVLFILPRDYMYQYVMGKYSTLDISFTILDCIFGFYHIRISKTIMSCDQLFTMWSDHQTNPNQKN